MREQSDVADRSTAPAGGRTLGIVDCLALPVLLCLVIPGLALGGWATLASLAVVAAAAFIADGIADEDPSNTFGPPAPAWAIELPIYGTVLLVPVASLAFAWRASELPADPWTIVIGTVTLGICYGTAAIAVGHELIHCLDSTPKRMLGVFLQSFPLDAADSVEHVWGHHETVATLEDPTTARRGEGFWAFVPRSVIGAFASAWRLEAQRRRERGLRVIAPGNEIIIGQAMQLGIALAFWLVGGWTGVAIFVAAGLQGRIYVETTKYMSHYGLVRVAGEPIEDRHSWNSIGLVAARVLLNSSWHSDHHVHPERRFWDLEAPDGQLTAPYPGGMMAAFVMLPPVWFRVTGPRLQWWDEHLASDAERAFLAGQTN